MEPSATAQPPIRLFVRLAEVNATPLIFDRKTLLFVVRPWPPRVLLPLLLFVV